MRLLFVLCLCVGLTGCFDLRQDLTFNEDETVEVNTRLAFNTAFLAMTDGDGGPAACDEGDLGEFQVKVFHDGPDTVCESEGQIPNSKLNEFYNTQANDHTDAIKLTALGDGNYRLDFKLTFAPNEPTEDEEFAEGIKSMFLAAIADRALVWNVHAYEITSSDAVISEDRKSAKISVPLVTLFDDTGQTVEHFVEFSTKPKSFWRRWFE